ncbi:hypothetical protein GCM10010116_17290 [Microbispora rosea subsp. aerata]|nr:hypothetical protein GCM10010116_17290 [Microbispora rosea subsp. aerata]
MAGAASPQPTLKYQARAADTTSVPRVMKPRTTTSSIVIARAAGGAYEGAAYISFSCCTLGVGPAHAC